MEGRFCGPIDILITQIIFLVSIRTEYLPKALVEGRQEFAIG